MPLKTNKRDWVNSMKYENEIREIVLGVMNNPELNSATIEDDLQNFGMNSILFIKIVVEIENRFNIEFPDEKLLITQAGTIKELCEIIESFDL